MIVKGAFKKRRITMMYADHHGKMGRSPYC